MGDLLKRYVDDIFLVFINKSHKDPFLAYVNVLCHCNINMKLVTGRHNAILYMVEKALKHEIGRAHV